MLPLRFALCALALLVPGHAAADEVKGVQVDDRTSIVRIWLGPKPVQADLKEELLGG